MGWWFDLFVLDLLNKWVFREVILFVIVWDNFLYLVRVLIKLNSRDIFVGVVVCRFSLFRDIV